MTLRSFFIFTLLGLYLILLCRLVLKKKILGKHIEFFTMAIFTIFFTETSALICRQYLDKDPTILYNIGIIGITYFLFLFYFFKLTENQKLKKLQRRICVFHVINFFVFAFITKDFITVFSETTNFTGIFLLLVSVAVFMIDTLNSEHVLRLRSYYPFYVALSLVLIYTGLIPLLFFGKIVTQPSEAYVFQILMLVVNWIGYILLIAGTFYAKKINTAYEI